MFCFSQSQLSLVLVKQASQRIASNLSCSVCARCLALPRPDADIHEWALEEMIRDVIGYNFRPDIADRAIAWLDQRVDAYKRLHGTLQ